MGIEAIALRVCAGLVIEREERTVANDRIGGGSKDAARVSVRPNDVSRGFGQGFLHGNGPGLKAGAEGQKGYMKQAMCERLASLIMVNQYLMTSRRDFVSDDRK